MSDIGGKDLSKHEAATLLRFIVHAAGGVAFGYWMESFAAGVWMTITLMIFEPLLVKIEKE